MFQHAYLVSKVQEITYCDNARPCSKLQHSGTAGACELVGFVSVSSAAIDCDLGVLYMPNGLLRSLCTRHALEKQFVNSFCKQLRMHEFSSTLYPSRQLAPALHGLTRAISYSVHDARKSRCHLYMSNESA